MTKKQWVLAAIVWFVAWMVFLAVLPDRQFLIRLGDFLLTFPMKGVLSAAWIWTTFKVLDRERYDRRAEQRQAESREAWRKLREETDQAMADIRARYGDED